MEKSKQYQTKTRIEEEYTTPDPENDDDEMLLIREALDKALTRVERKIFLTYTEMGSYTSAAKAFGVSTPTLSTYINALRGKITKYVHDNI